VGKGLRAFSSSPGSKHKHGERPGGGGGQVKDISLKPTAREGGGKKKKKKKKRTTAQPYTKTFRVKGGGKRGRRGGKGKLGKQTKKYKETNGREKKKKWVRVGAVRKTSVLGRGWDINRGGGGGAKKAPKKKKKKNKTRKKKKKKKKKKRQGSFSRPPGPAVNGLHNPYTGGLRM